MERLVCMCSSVLKVTGKSKGQGLGRLGVHPSKLLERLIMCVRIYVVCKRDFEYQRLE